MPSLPCLNYIPGPELHTLSLQEVLTKHLFFPDALGAGDRKYNGHGGEPPALPQRCALGAHSATARAMSRQQGCKGAATDPWGTALMGLTCPGKLRCGVNGDVPRLQHPLPNSASFPILPSTYVDP